MCLKYPMSGHSRQHSDVAMAVDLRRHQGGEALAQLEGEIARGDWTLKPADAETIFGRKSEHAWPEERRTARGVFDKPR